MNNLGFSIDNLHIGDVRIKGQGETLRIGNENNGLGYILPVEKGASGDVLTMNADNSTSFQPIPAPATTIEKPIQNLFTMLTPRTSYTIGNADPYFLSGSGSEIVDTTNFEVGDVIRVRVEGYYVNNAVSPNSSPCTITHQWFIDMPNTSPSNETLSTPVQFFGSGGNWFNEVIITWESPSSVRITFNGKINYNTGFQLSDEVRALNWFVGGSAPPGTERPKSAGSPYYIYPPPANLWIRGQNRTDAGDGYAIATNYYMDKMNVNALVSGGGVPTIDHLTLSNLNVASGSGDVDAGHSTLVCLDGRAGGQQIIGGRGSGTLILKSNDTTPLLNNIELGSGLDTKIHKIFSNSVAAPLVIEHESALDKIDLRINNNNKVEIKDTEVQLNEDLNMNSNNINNVSQVNGQGGLNLMEINNTSGLMLIDGSELRLTADTSIKLYPTVDLRLGAGGSNIIINPSSEVDVQGGINMNTNDITNANVIVRASNGNVINFNNDIFPPLITGALTIESGAGKEININADDVLRLSGNNIIHNAGNTTGVHQFSNSGGLQVQFTNVDIEMFKALDMKNNNINNVSFLTASTVQTDTIENSGSGFLTFTNLGPVIPSFTPSGLDLNLGNINNVDTIENTGSANITLPVVIGTPSGALQVKNGGAYIKQDLQVDGNIYCDSINNIRPSGGLYSESSGFNIPSTNLTETNLLGQGGSAGTLAIPANTFTQFDSYSFKASGVLSGGSNDTATLRLKSLVNGTTPVELGSIVIQLTDNGLVDVAWKVEADFNVRTLGVATVGVLVLSGNFAYTNNNDVVKTYLRTIVNNTVFDTTQSNELQFTYQNDATNPLTNIRIEQASFTKWY